MDFSVPSLFSTPSPLVTDEDFNLYHSSDRRLYKRLIIELGRDPEESMRVMAFWLWLEQEIMHDHMTLVSRMLSLPSELINIQADESVLCLGCVGSDTFPFAESRKELVLLPTIVGENISLQYFHENRIRVLRGVTGMLGEVCIRAFRDILENAFHGRHFNHFFGGSSTETSTTGGHGVATPPIKLDGKAFSGVGVLDQRNSNNAATVHAPLMHYPFNPTGVHVSPLGLGEAAISGQQFLPSGIVQGYAATVPGLIVSNEISDMFSSNLNVREGDSEVSPDERTIFLTFSKGYPITETEVRDFFTRRFGDFIEAIYMQEVPHGEQILFARIVAFPASASIIDVIVEGGRAKYTINGKHVWARKYVKKQKRPTPVTAL